MFWLNEHIELDTNSTLYAIFLFSVLSVICSTITIIIYFRIKSLRTLIYQFFLHVAFNEWLSRLSYLILFIAEVSGYNIHMFRTSAVLINFTDTNIILLVTFACFGMYQLILKQNVKLSEKFHKISIILYSVSVLFTVILFCLSYDHSEEINDKTKERIDSDIYRNAICLFITEDYFKVESLKSIIFINCIYIPLLIASFVFIILIQVFVKDRSGISNINEAEEINKDKSIKSSLKLRTFKMKLLLYPLLNLAYIVPLIVYLWIEFSYLINYDQFFNKMYMLRIRYAFYNIYCFMNSIRGYIFFIVFINNEKIKDYLFKKYLHFDLFKTIDQINEEEEMSDIRSSKVIENTGITKLEKEINNNFESNFDSNQNRIKTKSVDLTNNVSDEEKKMIELDINPKKSVAKAGLINDEVDDDEDDSSDDDDDKEEKKLKTTS